jgi:hypothetical protein
MKESIKWLDETTLQRFEAIPLIQSEFIDSGQVRERMLQAVESNLQHAAEEGLLANEALFHLKDSCDMLLDPRYATTAHTETQLKDWWTELLEPLAEAQMRPSICPAALKMPVIGNLIRHWTLYQQSLGIDIAFAFIQIIAKVTAQYAHSKEISARRTDLDNDGRISREEYQAMFGNVDGFDEIDTDCDGYIDATELKQVKKEAMSRGMVDDAIDLEDHALLVELKSAAEHAHNWLQHQPSHIVAMVQTQHGTAQLLRKLWQMTETTAHTGAIGNMEAQIILEEIQHLETKNGNIYNLQKRADVFQTHEYHTGDTSATVHSPNELSMGNNPNLDEELKVTTSPEGGRNAPGPDKFNIVVS